MRLKVTTSPNSLKMALPVHYNSLVQGLLYNNLDELLAQWLHEKGHTYELRRFKLFTFSRLFGRNRVGNGKITFDGPVHFYVSSVDSEVLGSLAEHLLGKPAVHLNGVDCRVKEISVEPAPQISFGQPILIKTLSPITTYSTLSTPDGHRKTYYYSPHEDEWSDHIVSNLKRKAKALEWAADVEEDLKDSWVRPRRVRVQDQKILKFKGTVIKGWTGLYEVNLPEPYFRLAYDAGLGAKNSQGFGMVGVVNERKD